MHRFENFVRSHPRAIHFLDFLLPERIKKGLRRGLTHETYPMEEPFIRRVDDIEARFWIKNASDWHRIARKDFEGSFASELIGTIQPGSIFLDVGSAQGVYSILAAKAGADVYAIDPDPVSQNSIRNNLQLNEDVADRVHVFNMAIGAEDGEMTLNADLSGTYAPSFRRTSRELIQPVKVIVRSLDSLFADGLIPVPNVLKVDVEGAEKMALDGMTTLLASANRPQHLFIEIHELYLRLFGSSSSEVLQQIASMNYVPYGIGNEIKHKGNQLYHFVSQ